MSFTVSALLSLALLPAPGQSTVDADEPGGGRHAPERQTERLMNAGLPFAERMLAEHKEFAPFGTVLLPTGLIQTVGTNDSREQITVEEIYGQLIEGLERGVAEGDYDAVATFSMVELRHPEDGRTITAVHVALEHRAGYCVNVYYPTVVEGPSIVLGEAFAGRRTGRFFESCR